METQHMSLQAFNCAAGFAVASQRQFKIPTRNPLTMTLCSEVKGQLLRELRAKLWRLQQLRKTGSICAASVACQLLTNAICSTSTCSTQPAWESAAEHCLEDGEEEF